MNREDAKKEIVELEQTFPIPPLEGTEAIRAEETSRRLLELWGYVFCDEPAPADGWKPSVPAPTGDARDDLIRRNNNALIEGLNRDLEALERLEKGGGR
ncbi:MAG: hypothetical protein ACOX9C_04395 [Kiritimatiellia bacterium]|jgi:hypothetical protein